LMLTACVSDAQSTPPRPPDAPPAAATLKITSHTETYVEIRRVEDLQRWDEVTLTYVVEWYVPSPYIAWGGETYVDVQIDFRYMKPLDPSSFPWIFFEDRITVRFYPEKYRTWTAPHFTGRYEHTIPFVLNDYIGEYNWYLARVEANYTAKLYRRDRNGNTLNWLSALENGWAEKP